MANERAAETARAVRAAGTKITKLETRLDHARAERDAALRAAVDAGNRIDDVAPLAGLTPASARFVLYGKAKRERRRATA